MCGINKKLRKEQRDGERGKLRHRKGKQTEFSSFPVINLSLEGQRQGPGLTWSE